MSRLVRGLAAMPALVVLLMGAALVGTASAQPAAGLACGSVVAHSVVLTHDLGPCTGDGLVVKGSHIVVDLGGHTITGAHQVTSTPSAEQVGIRVMEATGDTVMNGTVAYFDGGVVIGGGSGNTVMNIYAHDNINRDLLSNAPIPPTPSQVGVAPYQSQCNYGDGIALFSSSGNRIEADRVVHNGPFSGIGLVGTSSHNTVIANQAVDNYVVDQTPDGGGTLCGSSVGVITGGMTAGRTVQDMGIRLEGSGAAYNTVQGNRVVHSGLDGIAIFDWFCNLSGSMHLPPTHNNSILANQVSGTGDLTVQHATGQVDSAANGIAVLSEGNGGVNCTAYDNTIARNTSTGNWQDGIFIGGMPSAPGHPQATTVTHNVVDGNHLDGIGVQAGAVRNVLTGNSAHGNTEFDGADYNFSPNCGTDIWAHNAFGTVNQPCVANQGTGSVRQVVFVGASAAPGGLQTTWSGLVKVTNPAGFTVYSGSDSTCSTPIGTGKATVAGNGTDAPTVSMTYLPPAGTSVYIEVAANSVSAGSGVGNAAVPCTNVTL